jgi:hypothetical protein
MFHGTPPIELFHNLLSVNDFRSNGDKRITQSSHP